MLIAYIVSVFIIGWFSERGSSSRFLNTIIIPIVIGTLLSLVSLHSAYCGFYGCYLDDYGLIYRINHLSIDPLTLGNILQAFLAGAILILLWNLPRVKRNIAKE